MCSLTVAVDLYKANLKTKILPPTQHGHSAQRLTRHLQRFVRLALLPQLTPSMTAILSLHESPPLTPLVAEFIRIWALVLTHLRLRLLGHFLASGHNRFERSQGVSWKICSILHSVTPVKFVSCILVQLQSTATRQFPSISIGERWEFMQVFSAEISKWRRFSWLMSTLNCRLRHCCCKGQRLN